MPTGKPGNRPTRERRRQQQHILLLTWTIWIILLCSLAACSIEPTGDFAIYLLQGQLSGAEILGVDPGHLLRQDQPLLTSQDMIQYRPTRHQIELTEAAYKRVWEMFPTPIKTDGIPFVVTVGDQAIYAGAFWTPLSSISYNGVVILQPMEPERRTIRIELGYPSLEAFSGRDLRADPRILDALQRSGKIK